MTEEKRDIEMHENDLFDAKQLDLSQGVETFQDVMENNPPNQLGWGYIRLYALCAIIYLCSTMNGFDGSLISSINAMQDYLDYYHLPPGGAETGLIFSIFNVS
jgi:hypothetical protein